MKSFMFVGFLLSGTVSATGLPCSIHPTKNLQSMELEALAKIGMPAARTTALNSVHRNGAKVVSEELEVEGGCLIYSFDIKIPGQRSIIEVAIDAGSGNVLAQKREGPKAQAAEAAADKAVSTAK